MKKIRIITLIISALCFFSAHPAAADITVGSPPNSSNCEPFGCNYVGDYQQVYSSSFFNHAIRITGIEFFNTVYNTGVTEMNSGNWDIHLSTTSADWNTLAVDYIQNIGADDTEVFNGNLYQAWYFGKTLSITFSTPFNYNPQQGNLLLDIMTVNNSTGTNYAIFFDASSGNDDISRGLGGSYVDYGYGLMTRFVTVPEPATMLLLGFGLVGVAVVRMKKN